MRNLFRWGLLVSRHRTVFFILTIATLWVGVSAVSPIRLAAMPNPPRVMEGYPDDIQAKLENRDRLLRNLRDIPSGMTTQYVIRTLKRWRQGQTVKVSFSGGTPALHKDIADTANEWTQFGNLKLDFGFDAPSGKFREWRKDDSSYSSEIRISFNYGGYWSLIGTDSVNQSIVRPNEPSMNFGGFDVNRPFDWQATVRHEFGHALGFEHEHQHPVGGCDLEWRWENDPGYEPTQDAFQQFIPDSKGRRPGVYTVLGGAANFWPKEKVDFNLRQLTDRDSHAFLIGPFSPTSIMKYYFEPGMFRLGTESICDSDENLVISDEDQRGMTEAYPKNSAQADKALREHTSILQSVVNSSMKLGPESVEHYRKQMNESVVR